MKFIKASRNTIAFFFLFKKYFSRGERSKGVFDLEVIKNNSCMNLEKYHWVRKKIRPIGIPAKNIHTYFPQWNRL